MLGAVFLLLQGAAAAQTPSQEARRSGPSTQNLWDNQSHLVVSPSVKKHEEGYTLHVETNLVVLNTTVLDKHRKPVLDLKENNFKVYEDSVEQKLKVFKHEDIPVSVGILVDNSGSMRDKRIGVNEAALKFVKASNPLDEVFIVNFNDEAFLDADFTNNIKLLKRGLNRIDARGGTALYDALDMSLKYLTEKGTRDKKVLLIITDGEDNASRLSLEQVVKAVQRSNAVIYTVGLLGEDGRGVMRRAKRALKALAKASGGAAFFPKNPAQVNTIATQISTDIRNQYVLAYTPTNLANDGSFRRVVVKVQARHHGKLYVRTRTGYYAKKQT